MKTRSASSYRSCKSSFKNSRCRCVRTVGTDIASSLAICLSEKPRMSRRVICACLGDKHNSASSSRHSSSENNSWLFVFGSIENPSPIPADKSFYGGSPTSRLKPEWFPLVHQRPSLSRRSGSPKLFFEALPHDDARGVSLLPCDYGNSLPAI